MPFTFVLGLLIILAACTAAMAQGQHRNPYLWGGIAAALGFFVFPLLAYLPMPVLYVLSRRAGAHVEPWSTALFRFTTGGLLGAIAGFVGGFLVPPSVNGKKIPFAVIFQDTPLADQMRSHMLVALTLGAVAGLGIAFAVGKVRFRTQ